MTLMEKLSSLGLPANFRGDRLDAYRLGVEDAIKAMTQKPDPSPTPEKVNDTEE